MMIELDNVVKEIGRGFVEPFEQGGLAELLFGKSKRIRSKLAILYLKSLGENITDNIYKLLAVGEIIHTASLLHDDVLDEADTRRGEITISKKYSSKIAVLSGDYLLSFGIEKLLELVNSEILSLFKDTTKSMSQAEIKQLLKRGKYPDLEDYLAICSGKTASLFATIMESVAILSNIDRNNAKRFGELFGIVFQIKNDIETFSSTQDKKNGIYTAYDILGIEKTTNLLDNYRQEMREIIGEFHSSVYKSELENLIEE